MITNNLSTLKINKLTQEQYDRELAAGNIDENAIYLVPNEGGGASSEEITTAISAHNTSTAAHEDIRTILNSLSAIESLTFQGVLSNSADVNSTTLASGIYELEGCKATNLPSSSIYGVFVQFPGDYLPQLVIGGGSGKGKVYSRRYLTASDSWLAWDSPVNSSEVTSAITSALANYVTSTALDTAVTAALEEAKTSGEFDGADGYTPVKGTDYWTETDKAEIVEYVLDSIGCPIWGVVDENNNIVLTGDLSEAVYSVKYEMADGTTIDIGDLSLVAQEYTITYNLYNVTSSNSASSATEGSSYTTTLSYDELQYSEFKELTVTMGGTDVTLDVVSGGVVNIPSVTGDIVITAKAMNGDYTVTYNLTGVTADNEVTEVLAGDPLWVTLTSDDGSNIDWTVTMGGVNVTNGIMDDGATVTIRIEMVDGDVVITASAGATGSYTNQIPISTDANGDLFVGSNGEAGYKTGYRLSNSTGNESTLAGYNVTGFIPVKLDDIVYTKGITMENNGYANIVFYDENKTYLSEGGTFTTVIFDTVDGDVIYGTLGGDKLNVLATGRVAYMRMSAKDINADAIITVNEPIIESEGETTTKYTNLADPADSNWIVNGRIGSDGTNRTDLGSVNGHATNFIPVSVDDVVRVQGGDLVGNGYGLGGYTTNVVSATNKVIVENITTNTNDNYFKDVSLVDGISEFTIVSDAIKYIRLTLTNVQDVNDVIITVNELIE